MFAGVGPIAVVAAKKVKFVYANDLNPTATSYMQHNLSLNKLAYKAEVWSSLPCLLVYRCRVSNYYERQPRNLINDGAMVMLRLILRLYVSR
jgi:tRNA G26 N,N-dimethylase Trm1